MRQWHAKPTCIADNGVACTSQIPSIVPIACSAEGAQPVVGVRLQHGRAGSSHLPTLATEIGRSTDLIKTPMGRRKLETRRESPLPCGLLGAIHIDHLPVG